MSHISLSNWQMGSFRQNKKMDSFETEIQISSLPSTANIKSLNVSLPQLSCIITHTPQLSAFNGLQPFHLKFSCLPCKNDHSHYCSAVINHLLKISLFMQHYFTQSGYSDNPQIYTYLHKSAHLTRKYWENYLDFPTFKRFLLLDH